MLAAIPLAERPWLAAIPAANGGVLQRLPSHLLSALEQAETELVGDGTAMVVQASPWRWGGPRAGEMMGSLTLRRELDGEVWDLVAIVTFDPDELDVAQIDTLVRWTTEGRLVSGQPPISTWWIDPEVLRASERAAIDDALRCAVPPARRFGAIDASAVALQLDAGSLGEIRGELVVELELGLAYVRATQCGGLSADAAARALRAAVADHRLAVPSRIRAALDRGLDLLTMEGVL